MAQKAISIVLVHLALLASAAKPTAWTCTDYLNGGTRNCCPTTGLCQDSSCTVFGFSNSAKTNCHTSGANPNCPQSFCNWKVASCPSVDSTHCYGTVACKDGSSTCTGYGQLCLEDGASDNFKICGDLCQDVAGWQSSTGNTCDDYRNGKWCENNTYGSGWSCDWGTFASWAVNGVDASTACCGCQGVAGTTPPPGCASPSPVPSSSPTGCQDVPGWVSSTGNTCDDYRNGKWCEKNTYGSGWQCQWGAFANWAVNGVDASTACCGCRGGAGTTPPPGCDSPSPLPGALCQAQEKLIPTNYLAQDAPGCSPDAVARLLRSYQCVQLQPDCPALRCNITVPPSVVQQVLTTCNNLTP